MTSPWSDKYLKSLAYSELRRDELPAPFCDLAERVGELRLEWVNARTLGLERIPMRHPASITPADLNCLGDAQPGASSRM
jgi:hypothetical protein